MSGRHTRWDFDKMEGKEEEEEKEKNGKNGQYLKRKQKRAAGFTG